VKRETAVLLAALLGLTLVPRPAPACGWWGETVGEPAKQAETVPGADENTIDLSTPEGKAQMGYAYLVGDGVPQDALVARRWTKQAAEAGATGAMNDYAVMLESGTGGPEDQAQAARWLSGWAGARQTAGIAAVFILANSIAGLAGNIVALETLPRYMWAWAGMVFVGSLIGTGLGVRLLPVKPLIWLLAAAILISGAKFILL